MCRAHSPRRIAAAPQPRSPSTQSGRYRGIAAVRLAARRNGIHQRQGFLRVVPVRAGQANRERHAPPVANQMALAPALGPVGRIRAALVTAMHRADGTTVDDRSRPAGAFARECHCGVTKRRPVRHARSETRGRPPFGRRGGVGKNGSTRSPTDREAAPLPPYPVLRYSAGEDQGFGGFVTCFLGLWDVLRRDVVVDEVTERGCQLLVGAAQRCRMLALLYR